MSDPPGRPGGGVHWRAVAPSALVWTHWETSSSLFNADTGETHLLDPLPAEVLQLLCRRSWPAQALGRHLAEVCGTVDDEPWRAQLAGLLAQLADLELIESAPTGLDSLPPSPAQPHRAVG